MWDSEGWRRILEHFFRVKQFIFDPGGRGAECECGIVRGYECVRVRGEDCGTFFRVKLFSFDLWGRT